MALIGLILSRYWKPLALAALIGATHDIVGKVLKPFAQRPPHAVIVFRIGVLHRHEHGKDAVRLLAEVTNPRVECGRERHQ